MFSLFSNSIRTGLCFCFIAVWAGSILAAVDPEQVFTVRGIIRQPYADGRITIAHEAIPNLMPAMTMPFYVAASDVAGLSPGDHVEFEFRIEDRRSRATKFRKLAAGVTPPAGVISKGASVAGARRLRPGDSMPAFALVDQDERGLRNANLAGQFTILTFVFTRCPVPEFCPLLGEKFQSLQQQLTSPELPPTRLLSITLDPDFDRPAVLQEYAKSLQADPSRWRFATGTVEEIEKLTRAFAVRTERNGPTLDHTLATALVGPDGKVIEIWRGNAWKPAEVIEKLKASAAEQR